MAATFDDFKLRYPELVAEGDANQLAIEACLEEALLFLNEAACPKIFDTMHMAWAAHCLARSGNNPNGAEAGAGAATTKTVGSVSITYAVSQKSEGGDLSDYFKSTPYGQQYLVYAKYCIGSGVRVAP